MILGLSHITLSVTSLERSLTFYEGALGLELVMRSPVSAYLAAGELWLCLVEDPAFTPSVRTDYTHTAFQVEARDYPRLKRQVLDSGAEVFKDNETEGESLYFLDPDGHKLELHVGTLESRLEAIREAPRGEVVLYR